MNAGLAYCEERGDCMFVGSVPEASIGGGTAIEYGAGFQGKKVYGALYGPWIDVSDPLAPGPTQIKRIPPDRPRDGRLRADRDDARHLQGARRATRRGCSARSTSSTS